MTQIPRPMPQIVLTSSLWVGCQPPCLASDVVACSTNSRDGAKALLSLPAARTGHRPCATAQLRAAGLSLFCWWCCCCCCCCRRQSDLFLVCHLLVVAVGPPLPCRPQCYYPAQVLRLAATLHQVVHHVCNQRSNHPGVHHSRRSPLQYGQAFHHNFCLLGRSQREQRSAPPLELPNLEVQTLLEQEAQVLEQCCCRTPCLWEPILE